MSVDWRRMAKLVCAVSIILLLTSLILALSPLVDDAMRSRDPEYRNIARLEAGDSNDVELFDSNCYLAYRLIEGDENIDADLRMIKQDGGEEEGSEPSWQNFDLPTSDGKEYRVVRTFCFGYEGNYSIHNDGASTLWLVNDTEGNFEAFFDPYFLLMSASCCFGLITGIVAIILAIMALKFQNTSENKVMGIVVNENIMSTDELYRSYHKISTGNEVVSVADPFIDYNEEIVGIEKLEEEVKDGDEGISEDEWKEWDEG